MSLEPPSGKDLVNILGKVAGARDISKIPLSGGFDWKKEIWRSITISIPLRKPRGHASRAPGVILEILEYLGAATFWRAEGYWEWLQEPVTYIEAKHEGPSNMILDLAEKLKNMQYKLRQQEIFVTIDNHVFVGSLISSSQTNSFPKQMEFDDDMNSINSLKSRQVEPYEIIYGRRYSRIFQTTRREGNPDEDALKKAKELFSKYLDNLKTVDDIEKIDVLTASTSLISLYAVEPNRLNENEKKNLQDLIRIGIKLQPFGEDSDLNCTRHQDALIRWNRMHYLNRLNLSSQYHSELTIDGVLALGLILESMMMEETVHLGHDPITNMVKISGLIQILKPDPQVQRVIRVIFDEAKKLNPEYAEDLEDGLAWLNE